MTATFLVLLMLLGLLFLVAELVLLPGVSVGALLSMICYGGAVYLAYAEYGLGAAACTVVAIVVISVVATILSLRAKTWQRFSLRQQIDSSSMPLPSEQIAVGDRGTTLSRLSPMGKVEIGGRTYEAKSLGAYVDPRSEVEVVGFENFSVIVKPVKNQ